MWQLYGSVGAVAAIFKMAAMNFQCPIYRQIISRKLICVSLSLLSESQNPNMVNILVSGICGLWQPFSKWPP